MSMRFPSMFKTPKHRSFDYKPIIYDENKEKKDQLNQLVEEVKSGEMSDEVRRHRLAKIYGGTWTGSRTHRKKQSLNQQARLIVIMAVLFGLVWFFFNWS